MKVFISWSGDRGALLARAIKEWIPLTLQYVQTFVSDADIEAGDRWATQIGQELESSNFGIICITPENLGSDWLLFEAGALSRSMEEGKVIPLLFQLDFSDLTGPLAQFQAKKADQRGVLDILRSINSVSETGAPEATIESLVPSIWPKLEEKIVEIENKEFDQKKGRKQNEVLEDLVTNVRGLRSSIANLDHLVERTPLIKEDPFYQPSFESIFEYLEISKLNENRKIEFLARILEILSPILSVMMMEYVSCKRDGSETDALAALIRRTFKTEMHNKGSSRSDYYRAEWLSKAYIHFRHLVDM